MSFQVMSLAMSVGIIAFLAFVLYKVISKTARLRSKLSTAKARLVKSKEIQHTLKEKLADLENKIANNRIDDQLTGLPSRQTFQDRLIQTFSQSQRYNFVFALLVLDLDGFRVFKNVLGLDACNQLLKEVAIRLQSCIRPMDTVCRAEGSEFVIIIPQLAKPETAAYVAKRLLEVTAQPFTIQGKEIFLTASIGVAVYPNDGKDPTALTHNADQALLQAKSNGNNTYQFYQKEMHAFSERELTLSSSLHNVESFRDFVIHYQPWLNVESKKIVCMEAFLNWNHPEFGLIPQQDVIRLVEKSGNVLAIGEWLLRNACQQLQKWQTLGFHPDAIAVNISARQLENPHFTYQVSKLLQEMKLDPSNLILELSEIFLVNKIGMVEKSLRLLKKLGIQICVSHFGTGNLSLQSLKNLPINSLKMDQTLLSDIASNPETGAIVKMIIALATSLKVQVIAEGVENQQQKQHLKELGCYVMQGNMICPPLAVAEFTAVVEKGIIEKV